ncbi:hypothetical protein [Roseibium sp.]
MPFEPIRQRRREAERANLRDCDAVSRTFSWDEARGLLDGMTQ